MSTKVLVVDDEEAVTRLFAEMLQRQGAYDIVTETDGNKVLPRLRQEQFDIVLLDMLMPMIDGLELLRQIRQHHTDIPVLIVTGHGSIETAVQAMQAGAADLIAKPVQMSILHLRLQRALDNARLKRLSGTDDLTGLYNLRAFLQRVAQEVERANRYYRPLSLLLIDIDHFRRYNATQGHTRGNAVLLECAWLLRDNIRSTDVVARYSSRRFAVILPETTKSRAMKVGQRLRQYFERHKFPGEEFLPAKFLTISVGVAAHEPFFGTSEALIATARMALYTAKREGRNRVRAVR